MTSVVSHPAPHRNRVSFWALMFGTCAAPLFWLGQEMLSYGFSSHICYGSDHPTVIRSAAALRGTLMGFDVIALLVTVAGGIVSYICWRAVRDEKEGDHKDTLDRGDGRVRFMALWGIMSSIWFFGAVLFTTIASVGVPLCAP